MATSKASKTESVKEKTPMALQLMEKNRSVKDRASAYFESVRRDIQRDVIDTLVAKKEKLEDELFELTNFVLDTNINAGLRTMTKEECKSRFEKIINTEFELEILSLELSSKKASFDKYFV
jgi:hypothetical protein